MRRCLCGQWPLREYGPVCPSCLESIRSAITDEVFGLRDRVGLSGDEAAIVATRVMVAVERVIRS